MSTPLWEMKTDWLEGQSIDCTMNQVYDYRSWKEFVECKPYRFWKPYILSSWCWNNDKFQIVFISPNRFTGMNRVEIVVKKEDEPVIRHWIKSHMPSFWKL